MSTLPTYGAADLDQAMAAGYAAAAQQSANLGAGSQMGPIFKSVRLAIQLLQNENQYIDSISRLQNMQDPLSNGLPNPDVDTFINAFGFFRPNGSFASGIETFSMPSPVGMDTIIPVGATVQSGNGVQYEVAAGGVGYSVNAGGYVILSGQSSVNALIVATTPGSVGNTSAGAINQVFPISTITLPSSLSCANASGINNGLDAIVGAPLYSLFADYMSGGGEGSVDSILAATGLTPGYSNIIFSLGDLVMAHASGSNYVLTPNVVGWFTLVVNIANQGTVPPPTGLMAAVQAELLLAVKAAGISYLVIPPVLQQVAMSGSVVVKMGYDDTTVVNAVIAAGQAFANGIGLDPYGGATYCPLSAVYAALSAVPGVARIDGLTINGGTADIVGAFGTQLVAGTMSFT